MSFLLIILAVVFVGFVLATACRTGHKGLDALRNWNYAHRGLHAEGVPENSMLAFELARDAGYGVELDVHLLADGNLGIMHDSSLKRTTGAEGKIEDLTQAQLNDYRLENTDQRIPTLEQALAMFDGKVPLIIELKPVGNNIAPLCERVCEALADYTGVYCVESFDPRCVYWFRKNRPEIVRGQLTENFFASPTSTLPWYIKFAMRHQLMNFMTRPDFVAYRFCDRRTISNVICRKIWRAQGVTWTLTTPAEHATAQKEGWIPIFEGYRP